MLTRLIGVLGCCLTFLACEQTDAPPTPTTAPTSPAQQDPPAPSDSAPTPGSERAEMIQGLRDLGIDVQANVREQPSMAYVTSFDAAGEPLAVAAAIFIDEKTLALPYEVIDDATSLRVDLGNCEQPQVAGLVGADSTFQMALIELTSPPTGVTPLPIADLPMPDATIGLNAVIRTRMEDCGYLSALCAACAEVMDIRSLEGLGEMLIVDHANELVAWGSPYLNEEGRVIALLLGPAAGGSSFGFPAARLSEIERIPVIPIDAAFPTRARSDAASAVRQLHQGAHARLQNRHAEAIALLEPVLTMEGPAWKALYTRGVCLDVLGQRDQAIDALRQSIEIEPQYAESQYSLGIVLMKLGRFEEALPALREAIRLDSRYAAARGMLSVAQFNLGNVEEAFAVGEEAIHLDAADAQAFANLSLMYERADRIEDRVRVARLWTERMPHESTSWSVLAEVLLDSDRHAEIVELLDRPEALRQENPYIHMVLATALGEAGKYDRAREVIDEAIRLFPDEPMLPGIRELIDREEAKGG